MECNAPTNQFTYTLSLLSWHWWSHNIETISLWIIILRKLALWCSGGSWQWRGKHRQLNSDRVNQRTYQFVWLTSVLRQVSYTYCYIQILSLFLLIFGCNGLVRTLLSSTDYLGAYKEVIGFWIITVIVLHFRLNLRRDPILESYKTWTGFWTGMESGLRNG